jgi:hypothetical protein
MRARFDFSKVTRGRFADRYRIGHTVTLLDHDPDEERMRENEEQAQNTRKSGMRIFESQVREAGLRLGEPARQSGIDYFIYSKTQTGEESLPFPVKLKTSVHEVFSLYKKESRIPRLLMAYVWHAKNPDESEIYALTYKEALEVVKRKPYASTKSWVEDGGYSVTHAGAELKAMLTQYRMNPKKWRDRLQSI